MDLPTPNRPRKDTAMPETMTGTRVETVDTMEEFATIGHMRGWCHDTSMCAICAAQADTVRMRAATAGDRQRAIRAEINNAYLARELMRAEADLNSIISG